MTAPHLMEQADEDGFKPIHLAVIQGTLETVNLLLANKVDVNALDNEGHSVVHWATGTYSFFIGITRKASSNFASVINKTLPSPIYYQYKTVFLVCGEADILRALLSAGANVCTPDTNGATPLHYAAQMCGYEGRTSADKGSTKLALDILNILLKHPQSSVEVEDKDGRQPLMWAASAGSEEAILALIKAGAYVESSDK